MQDRAKVMQPLLPLIERLALYPVETFLAVPAPPDQALRGLAVLQGLSRQIEVETEGLRRDQAAVDAAAEALRLEAPRLAEAAAAQKREAEALDQEIEAAHKAQAEAEAQADEAASQAAAAASRMESLRAALAAIETQRRADEAKAREEKLQGRTAEANGRGAGGARTGSYGGASHGGGHDLVWFRAARSVAAAGHRRGGQGLGRADGRRAGDRAFVSCATRRTRHFAVRWAGGFRRNFPELWVAANY